MNISAVFVRLHIHGEGIQGRAGQEDETRGETIRSTRLAGSKAEWGSA